MEQIHPSLQETTAASLLHELDLGQHRLCLMSDGSLRLMRLPVPQERMSSRQDEGICLDHDEAYRLFVSLYEQFQQQAAGVTASAPIGAAGAAGRKGSERHTKRPVF